MAAKPKLFTNVLCSGLPRNEHCLSPCLSARDENVAVLIYTQVRACLRAYNTLYSAVELFRECNCREQHPGELSGKLPPICRENCRVARLRKARPLYRPRVPNDRLAHPELLRIQQEAPAHRKGHTVLDTREESRSFVCCY